MNEKRIFDEIWDHHPELQNTFSSSWWFFLLLPKQPDGYGRKQMMFTYVSRMGQMVGIHDSWQPGMVKRDRSNIDQFPTQIAGWIYDGKNLHKNIVFTTAEAELNRKQKYCIAWNDDGSERVGGTIKASTEYTIGIDAEYVGKNGKAKFTAYGEDRENEVEMPQIVEWYGPGNGKLGNVHTVAWRRFLFKGEFEIDGDTIYEEGIGYFQRVLMNIPLQPWQWNYTAFSDGSIFSSFMMYSSFNLFRHSFKPLHPFFERRRYHIIPSAYYFDNTTGKTHYFDSARIIPDFDEDREVIGYFIKAKSAENFIQLYLKVNVSTNYNLKRKLWLNYHSTYSWTEFMVELQKIVGNIDGKILSKNSVQTGYGNVEYSMGISL